MAKKRDNNEAPKVEKVAPKKVVISNSTKVVKFKASKDSGKMKKDHVYNVSENVATILESKGLGKIN